MTGRTQPRRSSARRAILLAILASAGVCGIAAAVLGIASATTPAESAAGSAPAGGAGEAAASQAPSAPTPEEFDGASAAAKDEAEGSAWGLAARVDPGWLVETAAATGIPERALAAYAGAALGAETAFPGCGIGWNTLAGIGFVESEHGGIDGAVLGADGVARPSIIGPALDGTRFDAIPDTDGGAVDGDARWDRAVGPMQFIPETWAHYGRDGNGDGRVDVHQIDDAALGAATMLCDVGGDLALPENWIRAVDAYNPNLAYNNDVAEAAEAYAADAAAATG
ncbi:lytic murein transglycosylase [Leucobacter allii]|uniref:lytic transglycosylase domain-containing protein n=1 Tax=Leucobacter allii TaxID=2932247 RepID=UPI001FD5CDCA|nr:lytic murein transglycosylase [Leucobacter allii]UOR02214.1 lytic murein transglycosylase [Leucobacter allii]